METADQDNRPAVVMLTRIDGIDRMLSENQVEAGKLLAFHDAYIGDYVQQHNGHVLEARQGSLMARFGGAKDAVTCGMAIQEAMKEYNRGVSVQNSFRLRIGIHMGDFVFNEKGAAGPGFKIVVGLREMAPPGRIYLSAEAYEAANRDTGVHAVSRGKLRIKGVDKPLSIFEMLSLGGRSRRTSEDRTEHRKAPEETQGDSPEGSSENGAAVSPPEEGEASAWTSSSFFSRIDETDGVPMMEFQDQHPETSRKLLSFLERLARKGVIRKTLQEDGVVEYSLASPRDLMNLKKFIAKDRGSHRDPSVPPGGYRIKPSVFVGGIGAVVILSIAFSVITGGALFPLLVLAGLFVWIRRSRIAASRERFDLEEPMRNRFEGATAEESTAGASSAGASTARGGTTGGSLQKDLAGLEAEALKLAGFIRQELNANAEISEEVRRRFIAALEDYHEPARALRERSEEISRILRVFPMNSLDKDLKILQDRRQRTDDGSLKEEYGESIRQIEKQRAKHEQLQNQKESIQQRLRSALSSLKQIYLSVARMKGSSDSFGIQPLEALREESRKLGDFLDDLKRETTL